MRSAKPAQRIKRHERDNKEDRFRTREHKNYYACWTEHTIETLTCSLKATQQASEQTEPLGGSRPLLHVGTDRHLLLI